MRWHIDGRDLPRGKARPNALRGLFAAGQATQYHRPATRRPFGSREQFAQFVVQRRVAHVHLSQLQALLGGLGSENRGLQFPEWPPLAEGHGRENQWPLAGSPRKSRRFIGRLRRRIAPESDEALLRPNILCQGGLAQTLG